MLPVSSYGEIGLPLSIEQLDPLLNNLVEISSCKCRVHDVVIALLAHLQMSRLSVHSVYFAGSYLTHLFAYPVDCNDIDMKIVVEGAKGDNPLLIFHEVERIFSLSLSDILESKFRMNNSYLLKVKSFKPIFISNYSSCKGYTLGKVPGYLPFEISVLVTDSPDGFVGVMNVDSLMIHTRLFESSLGTTSKNQFSLSSGQGESSSVITNIKNRVLTATNPQNIQKFGWCRYLMCIIDGFTAQSPHPNQAFYQNEARAGDSFIYDMHQFVSRKKREQTPLYWTFFLCNAIFHCPERGTARALDQEFNNRGKSLEVQKRDLLDEFSRSNLIPLFSSLPSPRFVKDLDPTFFQKHLLENAFGAIVATV